MLGAGRASLMRALPQVTESANRADEDAGRLDLRPQPRHVHLDRVRGEWLVETEQALGDLVLAEHAAGAREEELEQRPPAWRQVDRLVVDANPLGRDVPP